MLFEFKLTSNVLIQFAFIINLWTATGPANTESLSSEGFFSGTLFRGQKFDVTLEMRQTIKIPHERICPGVRGPQATQVCCLHANMSRLLVESEGDRSEVREMRWDDMELYCSIRKLTKQYNVQKKSFSKVLQEMKMEKEKESEHRLCLSVSHRRSCPEPPLSGSAWEQLSVKNVSLVNTNLDLWPP